MAAAGLAAVDGALVERYQPYWTVQADVVARRGDGAGAAEARARALALTDDDAVRAYLTARWADDA